MVAHLYFRYGTMSSGKSETIISIAKNYEIQGKYTFIIGYKQEDRVFKEDDINCSLKFQNHQNQDKEYEKDCNCELYKCASYETKYHHKGDTKIFSRNGKSLVVDLAFDNDTDIQKSFYKKQKKLKKNHTATSCILVDEAQFLTTKQVYELARLVDEEHIPVIAYGLKTDFRGVMFEGSYALLSLADKIEEHKNVCWYCQKKAIMQIRLDKNNTPTFSGDQISIGFQYLPVCRKHWMDAYTKWLKMGEN